MKDQPSKDFRFEWERAMRGAGLRPMLRLYLLVLGSYMDADGNNCFVSAQAVADDLGVKRATVFDLQREGIESGWLVVVSKGGVGKNGGQGMTNRYLPRIPDEAQQSGVHPTVVQEINSRVATDAYSRAVTTPTVGQAPDSTTQPDQPGTTHVVALIDLHWSAVSTAKERARVATKAAEVCAAWSPATVEAVIAWGANEARGIGMLGWSLDQVDGLDDAGAVARVRRGSSASLLVNCRPGTSAEHGPTRRGTL